MANSQRPAVNQRLYYCRLHLQWLSEQLSAQQLPRHLLEQALGESIVSHLVMAFRAYLLEIAEAYAVDAAVLHTANELVEVLGQQGIESAEARELQSVETETGWLGQLLQHFASLGYSPSSARQKTSASLIATAQPSSPYSCSEADLTHYFQQLSAIIENQRGRLEEW